MSPSVKLGLLTLVSSAAAIPHYGHSHFHKASGGYSYPVGTGSGAPFPTSGYGHNHTLPHGSGTGAHHEPTTTILQSETSTLTIYSTVYATPSPVSAGAEDVSSGAAAGASSSAAGQCGPATVYVTATNKVTVTVTPGSSSSSSSAAVYVAPSSAEAVASSSSAYKPKPKSSSSTTAEAALSSAIGYIASSFAESMPFSSFAMALPTTTSEKVAVVSVTLADKAPTSAAAVYSSAAAKVSSAAAASSSAASSSGGNSYSGAKRGLAYNDNTLCSAFSEGSYGFSYNWGQTGSSCAGAAFVPMVNKPSDSTAEAWLANVDTAVKNGATMVMGFNECDISTQCNLSPAAACASWKTYMNPIRSAHPSVTILGPSVSNSGTDGQGLSWLSEFVSECPDAEWDATNIHFYDIPDGDNCENTVSRFESHFSEAASTFGKKVFVTEFGLNSGSASASQASEFLSGVMSYMDGEDTCSGYAYFMVGTDSTMNELVSGTALSSVGETYNS